MIVLNEFTSKVKKTKGLKIFIYFNSFWLNLEQETINHKPIEDDLYITRFCLLHSFFNMDNIMPITKTEFK